MRGKEGKSHEVLRSNRLHRWRARGGWRRKIRVWPPTQSSRGPRGGEREGTCVVLRKGRQPDDVANVTGSMYTQDIKC